MSCEKVQELLENYLAGLLTPEQVRAIEDHLATCPTCRSLFLPEDPELEALLATDWFAAEPPTNLVANIMQELPARRSFAWPRVAVITVAWCCYFAFWLISTTKFWLPQANLLVGRIILGIRSGVYLCASVARTCWHALSLLKLTPLGIILLLMFLITSCFSLYRLQKEDWA